MWGSRQRRHPVRRQSRGILTPKGRFPHRRSRYCASPDNGANSAIAEEPPTPEHNASSRMPEPYRAQRLGSASPLQHTKSPVPRQRGLAGRPLQPRKQHQKLGKEGVGKGRLQRIQPHVASRTSRNIVLYRQTRKVRSNPRQFRTAEAPLQRPGYYQRDRRVK